MSKEHCECKKIAVWCYLPGFLSGDSPYFCDDCVPRGCDCNHEYCQVEAYHPPLTNYNFPIGVENVDWKWIEKNICWTPLDEQKREFPCSEYDYDPDGHERESNPHIL